MENQDDMHRRGRHYLRISMLASCSHGSDCQWVMFRRQGCLATCTDSIKVLTTTACDLLYSIFV